MTISSIQEIKEGDYVFNAAILGGNAFLVEEVLKSEPYDFWNNNVEKGQDRIRMEVRFKTIAENRLPETVTRLWKAKFRMGLAFDDAVLYMNKEYAL